MYHSFLPCAPREPILGTCTDAATKTRIMRNSFRKLPDKYIAENVSENSEINCQLQSQYKSIISRPNMNS